MSQDRTPGDREKSLSGLFRRWKGNIARGFKALAARHPSLTVATQAGKDFSLHRMTLSSAYFAYHCFMAIFPLLLLVSSVLGFVLKSDPALQQEIMKHIYDILPDFGGSLKSALNAMVNSRHLVGIIGLLGLLWAGTRISKSLEVGTNVIWGVEKRSFFKRKLLALGILGFLGLLGLLALGINLASSSLLTWISEHVGAGWTAASFVFGKLVGLLLVFVVFTTIYKLVPQERPRLADAIKGALLATVLFRLTEYAFNYYLTNISKAQALYGTIGVIIGVLIWLYLIGMVVFFGAEIVHLLSLRKTAMKNGEPSPAGGGIGMSARSIDSE